MSNTFWLMIFIISAQMLSMYIAYRMGASSPCINKLKDQFKLSDVQCKDIIQRYTSNPVNFADYTKKIMAQGIAHGYFLGHSAMARKLTNMAPMSLEEEITDYTSAVDRAFKESDGQEVRSEQTPS